MFFSSTNLIDQATLIRSTRQMVCDVIPSAAGPSALGPTLDREQVLAALRLALADLDASDPLEVMRAIDVSAYLNQSMPLIQVSTRHLGAQITTLYVGDPIEANQVPFDIADAYQVRPHATIRSPLLWAVIRWPRRPEPIPLSDRPTQLPAFADVRCVISAVSGDPFHLFDTDGVALVAGDRCLACLGTGSDALANGIYQVSEVNFVRSPDAATVSDFAEGKVVRVREGDAYGETVWQVTGEPIGIGTSPIEFTMLTYPTNVDAAQATAHVIPRATAYLVAQAGTQIADKNTAQKCAEWSAAILARPLPAHADAVSRRVQTASEYATS